MANATNTSSAHSPSPWRIQYGDDGYDTLLLVAANGKIIATLHNTSTDSLDELETEEEVFALQEEERFNDNLLLAAPELLEGCDQAVKDLCFLQQCSGISRQDTIDRLEAIIAKTM
ncbi:hypothetical protein [Gimesia algae]|uniref:Uncharacterized protein n=1 Tax=Gimesia algae TaxID=2527971 RepID=A0A517VEQ2_9PLAN|nr:hypothetical protein [Gimesia algae]QDT91470.1 hypothetical protein Pan161_31280 [Gimesia algae]